MNLSEKGLIILDMIQTIQGLNNRIGFQIPLNESALFFLKSTGKYYELRAEYVNQFTSLTEKDIYDDTFDKKVKSLEELIYDLENGIRFGFPYGVDYDSEYDFPVEKIIDEGVNELIECLKGIYFKRTDKQIYLYSLNINKRKKLVEDLIDLGKAGLKFELINEAKKEILIKGAFKALEFENVPTACRYYVGNSQFVDKDELKSFLENTKILSKKKNGVLNNKTKNSRMHSWIQGEKKKINNKIEFYSQENPTQN